LTPKQVSDTLQPPGKPGSHIELRQKPKAKLDVHYYSSLS